MYSQGIYTYIYISINMQDVGACLIHVFKGIPTGTYNIQFSIEKGVTGTIKG